MAIFNSYIIFRIVFENSIDNTSANNHNKIEQGNFIAKYHIPTKNIIKKILINLVFMIRKTMQ